MTTTPTFLVVGGARCGTTALAEGLRENPHVYVTDPKEPHYFALHARGAHFTAPGDDVTINRVAVTDRSEYLKLYPQGEHDYRALGDLSVSTMYYFRDALPEIIAMNPEMKLIAILREPVSRAFSAHQYMRARGLEPMENVLDAVALEPERIEAGWHHIWHYTSMSKYADAVAAMQQAVPPEQLGIWFYDDLDQDYDKTFNEILHFLDVPQAEGGSAKIPRVNVSGEPRSRVVHAAIAAATRNAALRRAVQRTTSYRFRERVRRTIVDRRRDVPEVSRQLAPMFADDLARLRLLLDQPKPSWLQEVDAA